MENSCVFMDWKNIAKMLVLQKAGYRFYVISIKYQRFSLSNPLTQYQRTVVIISLTAWGMTLYRTICKLSYSTSQWIVIEIGFPWVGDKSLLPFNKAKFTH